MSDPICVQCVAGPCAVHDIDWRARALAAEKQAEIDADRANIYRDKMQAAKDECRALEGRALKAEKQLATLAESGTGYSQQTVDAIVMERDALRGKVERLKQIAQTARNAKLSRFETGPVSTAKVRAAHKLSDKFLAVLNDKETK